MARIIEVSVDNETLYEGDSSDRAILKLIHEANDTEGGASKGRSYKLKIDDDNFSAPNVLYAILAIVSMNIVED